MKILHSPYREINGGINNYKRWSEYERKKMICNVDALKKCEIMFQ